jgi:hypothetical protein
VQIDVGGFGKIPWPTLAIGVLASSLIFGCAWVLLAGTRARELLATPARDPAALEIKIGEAKVGMDLTSIQSQPLLHASRAFYTAPLPDSVPTTPPRPDYRLAGTFLVPGKLPVALLVSGQGGASRRVRTGDTLDQWTVEAVRTRSIRLTWQTESVELTAVPPAAAAAAGLKRVPFTRGRLTSSGAPAGLQSLGAQGSVPAYTGGPASDQPRLYRPPPTNK